MPISPPQTPQAAQAPSRQSSVSAPSRLRASSSSRNAWSRRASTASRQDGPLAPWLRRGRHRWPWPRPPSGARRSARSSRRSARPGARPPRPGGCRPGPPRARVASTRDAATSWKATRTPRGAASRSELLAAAQRCPAGERLQLERRVRLGHVGRDRHREARPARGRSALASRVGRGRHAGDAQHVFVGLAGQADHEVQLEAGEPALERGPHGLVELRLVHALVDGVAQRLACRPRAPASGAALVGGEARQALRPPSRCAATAATRAGPGAAGGCA